MSCNPNKSRCRQRSAQRIRRIAPTEGRLNGPAFPALGSYLLHSAAGLSKASALQSDTGAPAGKDAMGTSYSWDLNVRLAKLRSKARGPAASAEKRTVCHSSPAIIHCGTSHRSHDLRVGSRPTSRVYNTQDSTWRAHRPPNANGRRVRALNGAPAHTRHRAVMLTDG